MLADGLHMLKSVVITAVVAVHAVIGQEVLLLFSIHVGPVLTFVGDGVAGAASISSSAESASAVRSTVSKPDGDDVGHPGPQWRSCTSPLGP